MQGLTFEYPIWFLLLCAIAGLIVAGILYYRDTTFKEQGTWLKILLGGLRWLMYSALAALLLSPLLKYLQEDRQDPIVVLAQDVSESIALETDTVEYKRQWENLRTELEKNYEVVTYQFGDAVREAAEVNFSDKRTNLNDILAEISDLYSNQNLGAVILASDGIYNEGANPAYSNLQIKAPIYTVGLGDTTERRDLVVRRVFHNKIAYLNDKFSIQVDVSARNAAGSSTRLTVAKITNGASAELHREEININSNDFFQTKEIILNADRAGVQRYRISVSGIADEVSTANNTRDIFVDVLDARQRILVLANAPHPDLSAMRQSLLTGKNNEVEVAYAKDFSGNLKDYDLVILHELPSAKYSIENVLTSIGQLNKPALFIVGESTNYNRLNAVQTLLNVNVSTASTNSASARIEPAFTLFTLSDELRQALSRFPPLVSPFGKYAAGPNTSTMLYQRIGRVDSDYPLLVLGESNGARTGVLAATGLWQWRLFDYLETSSHENFTEFLSQITQYLSVQEDKRRFRVSLPTNLFDENEPIQLDAELYNSNYELINEPEASVVITDENGRDYNYSFTRTTTAYTLNAGILPVGNYRYRAATNASGEELSYSGQFSVQSVDVERFVLEADHGLLRLLSNRYGGEFVTSDGIAGLPASLEARGTVKPVLFQTVTTRSVINLKWIFFALLSFLTLEWFLRRYFGGY